MPPVGGEVESVEVVDGTRDVAGHPVEGFGLAPVTLRRPGVDHGAAGGDRGRDLLGRGDTGPRVGHRVRRAGGDRVLIVAGHETVSGAFPCRESAVEDGDPAVTDGAQHPPQPSRERAARGVVGDDRPVRCDAETAEGPGERGRRRERVASTARR